MCFPKSVIRLTAILLLAPLLAARVVQLEEAWPEARAAAAFQVPGVLGPGLALRAAAQRARTPSVLLAERKAKRKKKKRPSAAGGEPAKGFGAAPEPAAPERDDRRSSSMLGTDEYDRSTLELQARPEPVEAITERMSAGVPGARTGRVPVEPVPGSEPVFALESALEASRVGTLREPAQYKQILAALMALPPGDGDLGDKDMVIFEQANRDQMDYRFLYMLTSEKLRAENTGDNATAGVLQAARVRAVKAGQKFDTLVYKQVAAAETRLGGVLSGYMQGTPPDAKAVRKAAGESPPEIFAFWFVLKAAEAAWENKAAGNPELAQQAGQKLGDLAEVRAALEDGDLLDIAGAREVNELLKLPDWSGYAVMASENGPQIQAAAAEAAARLAELADTDAERLLIVRRMGCVYCQAQRHSYSAYQPLVQRVAALYDVLLHGKLMPLAAVDIKSEPREPTSAFIKMANAADEIMKGQGVELPLFW